MKHSNLMGPSTSYKGMCNVLNMVLGTIFIFHFHFNLKVCPKSKSVCLGKPFHSGEMLLLSPLVSHKNMECLEFGSCMLSNCHVGSHAILIEKFSIMSVFESKTSKAKFNHKKKFFAFWAFAHTTTYDYPDLIECNQ